jgi:RimJ/RimL family protein N-acetyltransferase
VAMCKHGSEQLHGLTNHVEERARNFDSIRQRKPVLTNMKQQNAEIALRPFGRSDFRRLISWVPTPEAHGQWCGSFFSYPLDESRLQRYLDSARESNTRVIFTALLPSGEPVGHVEISQIWPYLSSRLSRVLVAPDRRQLGIGGAMVSRAVAFSFNTHHVDRIDLGVDALNVVAINCYRRQGFKHVGTWPQAIEAGPTIIDVYWMTLSRAAWLSRSAAGDIC